MQYLKLNGNSPIKVDGERYKDRGLAEQDCHIVTEGQTIWSEED